MEGPVSGSTMGSSKARTSERRPQLSQGSEEACPSTMSEMTSVLLSSKSSAATVMRIRVVTVSSSSSDSAGASASQMYIQPSSSPL